MPSNSIDYLKLEQKYMCTHFYIHDLYINATETTLRKIKTCVRQSKWLYIYVHVYSYLSIYIKHEF